jgi:Na+/melibiose symporter-like transporter
MRPGYLYFSTFIWLVLTGGRFTAPFLENIASFDDAIIGITISLQILIGSFLGSIGAVYSDRLELKHPNKGRLYCLAGAIVCGTISFEIHGLLKVLFEEKTTLSLVLHIVARMMYASCSAILFPVMDGITLVYLKKHNCLESAYGRERLFGAVAWAVASMMIGPILDYQGFGIFFMFAPLGMIFCLVVFFKYANESAAEESREEEDITSCTMLEMEMVEKMPSSELTTSTGDDIKVPLCNTALLFRDMLSTCVACGFVLSSFTLNMGTSVVENLIFLYFESLGGTNSICGLTVVVTVLFEIPIFHYAPQLLAFFGAENMQMIACIAYITRVVGYTYVPKGRMILVLLFEPLHGVTYACSKTSTVEFAARISPNGFEASSQGLLSMVLGMGSVLGVSLGGWIEKSFGPKVLYRLYAGIVTLGLFVFYFSIVSTSSNRRCYEKDQELHISM